MRTIAATILLCISSQVATEEALRPLLDFAGADAAQKWQAVNDGVMGGVSDGRFTITDKGTLEFFGTLSLENNGGFPSIQNNFAPINVSAYQHALIRLKGDGKDYRFIVESDPGARQYYVAAFTATADERTRRECIRDGRHARGQTGSHRPIASHRAARLPREEALLHRLRRLRVICGRMLWDSLRRRIDTRC